MPESNPRIANVLLPIALDGLFSYAIPPSIELNEGDVVSVPFGHKQATGVVWEKQSTQENASGKKLKSVQNKSALPQFSEAQRSFIDWMSNYTLQPRGMVLRACLMPALQAGEEHAQIGIIWHGHMPERSTAARLRVLELLKDGFTRSKTELAREAGVSPSVVNALIDDNILTPVVIPYQPPGSRLDIHAHHPELNEDQAIAAHALQQSVEAKAFSVTLLKGVTGSGKTEVYLEAIATALKNDQQALVLLPEIALTASIFERFEQRFGTPPATWHNRMSERQRARIWQGVAQNTIRLVIGARSGLFLPFQNLGLIVVDEEHDPSYKQDEGLIYQARDMAVVRARIAHCPLILASATPSIETELNVQRGRYKQLTLPSRYGDRALPDVQAIDLRQHKLATGQWISAPLQQALQETLENKQQALLFLNRRGFAPLTLCRTCGHRMGCPQCTAWLVEHRNRRALICHHCGYTCRVPQSCPSCGEEGTMTPCGPGVERLEEELKALFPQARILVLSSDVVGGITQLFADIESVSRGECDIIIGTQLVAKGHTFPQLSLVGIIDADVGLGGVDPRAAEKTFHTITQVVGRAGRGEAKGRALIQTYEPTHPVMASLLSANPEEFLKAEMSARERAQLPPYSRMVSLIISGPDKFATEHYAKTLARLFHPDPHIRLLGPAEAAIAMIRSRHRYRIMLRAAKNCDFQGAIRRWLGAAPRPASGIKIHVDVDPYHFL